MLGQPSNSSFMTIWPAKVPLSKQANHQAAVSLSSEPLFQIAGYQISCAPAAMQLYIHSQLLTRAQTERNGPAESPRLWKVFTWRRAAPAALPLLLCAGGNARAGILRDEDDPARSPSPPPPAPLAAGAQNKSAGEETRAAGGTVCARVCVRVLPEGGGSELDGFWMWSGK